LVSIVLVLVLVPARFFPCRRQHLPVQLGPSGARGGASPPWVQYRPSWTPKTEDETEDEDDTAPPSGLRRFSIFHLPFSIPPPQPPRPPPSQFQRFSFQRFSFCPFTLSSFFLDFHSFYGMRLPMKPNHATQPERSSIDAIVEILSRETRGTPTAADWRQVFLSALAKAPIIAVATRIAGVSPTQAFEERNNDRNFARLWDEAMQLGIDEIMAAVYLSAAYGDRKPVYRQGKQIGWTANHSRPNQAMLLQALRPQVFGKKKEPDETQKLIPMTLEEFRKRCEEAEQGSGPV